MPPRFNNPEDSIMPDFSMYSFLDTYDIEYQSRDEVAEFLDKLKSNMGARTVFDVIMNKGIGDFNAP